MGDSLEDNLQTALSNQLHHLLQAGAFNAAVTLPTASGRTMRKRWPSMQWSAAPLSGHRWRLHDRCTGSRCQRGPDRYRCGDHGLAARGSHGASRTSARSGGTNGTAGRPRREGGHGNR